jgi:hypothetical protein
MPLKLFLQTSSNETSSNKVYFPLRGLSSGGNPFPMKESKCAFKTLSIPEGSEGKISEGLFTSLLKCSQKHLGHSLSKDNDEDENL